MYLEDLQLENLQWLICDKTQPNIAFTSNALTNNRLLGKHSAITNTKAFQITFTRAIYRAKFVKMYYIMKFTLF